MRKRKKTEMNVRRKKLQKKQKRGKRRPQRGKINCVNLLRNIKLGIMNKPIMTNLLPIIR